MCARCSRIAARRWLDAARRRRRRRLWWRRRPRRSWTVRAHRPTYTVALVSGAKTLDSKPLKVMFDPDVHFATGEHEKYNAIVNDLHSLQRRGVADGRRAQLALSADGRRGEEGERKQQRSGDREDAVRLAQQGVRRGPEEVRRSDPAPAAGRSRWRWRRSRWRRRRSRQRSGEASSLKTSIAGIWETPSASLQKQYN